MKQIVFFILCLSVVQVGYSQKVATIEVDLSRASNGLDAPASFDLDAVTFLSDTILSFVEVQGSKKIPVPFQIENTQHRTLHWMVKAGNEKIRKRIYELTKGVIA